MCGERVSKVQQPHKADREAQHVWKGSNGFLLAVSLLELKLTSWHRVRMTDSK